MLQNKRGVITRLLMGEYFHDDMKERWYYIIGSLLAIIVAITVVWSIRFVYSAFDTALNPSLIKVGTTVTFNVDKLQGLLEKK